MSGSRFKNFSETNHNKYIFISENKILYDKTEKSYKFDANYLILDGDINRARIGICHHKEETVYAVNLKDINLVNKPEDADLIEIRSLANFNPEKDGIIFTAKQLVHWIDETKYCSRCSGELTFQEKEGAFIRPCNQEFIYPKISPCIITLVTKGDEILLARNKYFPENWYSALAGFIEAGETAEEALMREVMEEVNLKVKNIKYFGSQSWPFPSQLMLGYFCEYESGEIKVEEAELEDAKWFKINHLPNVPPNLSISGQLITSYLEDHLKP
tara:strand:- start:353 stop:1168 length:816 start_codon:yes stop_codon:yes gene_type:complete